MAGFYPGGTAGGDHDHRHLDLDAVTGRAGSSRVSSPDELSEQHAPDRTGDHAVRAGTLAVSTGPGPRRLYCLSPLGSADLDPALYGSADDLQPFDAGGRLQPSGQQTVDQLTSSFCHLSQCAADPRRCRRKLCRSQFRAQRLFRCDPHRPQRDHGPDHRRDGGRTHQSRKNHGQQGRSAMGRPAAVRESARDRFVLRQDPDRFGILP